MLHEAVVKNAFTQSTLLSEKAVLNITTPVCLCVRVLHLFHNTVGFLSGLRETERVFWCHSNWAGWAQGWGGSTQRHFKGKCKWGNVNIPLVSPSHNPFIFLAHCLHTLTYLHLHHHNSVLNIKLNMWTNLILKYFVQKHGIVLGPDLCTNGEVEGNVSSGSACTELQHRSSVLGKLSLAKYTSRYLFALALCQLKLTDAFGIMHILGFWHVDCDFWTLSLTAWVCIKFHLFWNALPISLLYLQVLKLQNVMHLVPDGRSGLMGTSMGFYLPPQYLSWQVDKLSFIISVI